MSDKCDDAYQAILRLSNEEYIGSLKEAIGLKELPFFRDALFCWVGENVLGCPRDQGKCRSCAGFVVSDILSAMLAAEEHDVAKRVITFFSVQHLVDCPKNHRNNDIDECGCKESTFEELFRFIKKNGLLQEVEYRYAGRKLKCMDPNCSEFEGGKREKKTLKFGKRARIHDHKKVPIKNFVDAQKLIRKRPVGAVIPVTQAFRCLPAQFEGIYHHVDDAPPVASKASKKKVTQKIKEYERCSKAEERKKPVSHAVLIIGFGIENNQKYYIIKNSWGVNWGFHGYAKIAEDLVKEVFYPKHPCLV